jgi:MFS family permease
MKRRCKQRRMLLPHPVVKSVACQYVPNGENQQREISTNKTTQWFLTVAAVLSSMFIYSLDNTITADLVPAIVNDFDSVPLLPWLSVGFMVGALAALLPVGKLYSKYDAKWLYIINVVIFLASSALCGAAPSMSAIIVGRVILGFSGNGMYCGILNLLSAYTDDHERPAYLSLIGFVWGIGTVLGPVVGGAFARVDWRWAFYINLIIGGIFLPVYIFVLPALDPLPKTVSLKDRAKNYDFLGGVLFVGFVMSLVIGINFGGALYAWNSGSIIALFVVAGCLVSIHFCNL